MSLDAIIITSEIEEHEVRDKDTIYIPGTYLHTDSYEEVIMILKGILSETLVNIYPKIYSKYVVL